MTPWQESRRREKKERIAAAALRMEGVKVGDLIKHGIAGSVRRAYKSDLDKRDASYQNLYLPTPEERAKFEAKEATRIAEQQRTREEQIGHEIWCALPQVSDAFTVFSANERGYAEHIEMLTRIFTPEELHAMAIRVKTYLDKKNAGAVYHDFSQQ